MDPERVPPLPQSEITSPVHALDEDTFATNQPDLFNPSHSNVPRRTARIDTSNLSPPHAGNVPSEPPIPEKSEVSRYHLCNILMIILCSLYDQLYLFDFRNQIPKKGKLE